VLRLESPHEARAGFGERVDRRQVRDEVGHDRIGERCDQPGDVDLRESVSSVAHMTSLDPYDEAFTRMSAMGFTSQHTAPHNRFDPTCRVKW
jgi:hypothetical protein